MDYEISFEDYSVTATTGHRCNGAHNESFYIRWMLCCWCCSVAVWYLLCTCYHILDDPMCDLLCSDTGAYACMSVLGSQSTAYLRISSRSIEKNIKLNK